jgi:hypothetical protein
MSVLFILLGIAAGIAIALALNKLMADKIENRTHGIALKTTAYIVCIILSMAFAAIGSLRTILDTFIEGRIAFLEVKIVELAPNSNILEQPIDTNEITSIVDELQQAVNDIDTGSNHYFESLAFDIFLNKLTEYIKAAKNSINTITGDTYGPVTIKSILHNLKEIALETMSPYFVFGQLGIVILLIVYIGIYAGIVVFLKKGGAMYNKSIKFGNIDYNNSNGEKPQNKE